MKKLIIAVVVILHITAAQKMFAQDGAPTATIGGYYHIGAGNTVNMHVYLTAGPWDITFFDGLSSWTVTGITVSPYTLSVTPTTTRTYMILDVYNGKCHNVGTGTAVVVIDPSSSDLNSEQNPINTPPSVVYQEPTSGQGSASSGKVYTKFTLVIDSVSVSIDVVYTYGGLMGQYQYYYGEMDITNEMNELNDCYDKKDGTTITDRTRYEKAWSQLKDKLGLTKKPVSDPGKTIVPLWKKKHFWPNTFSVGLLIVILIVGIIRRKREQ